VRLSCEGFDDDLMVLLTAIRVSRDQNRLTRSNSPPKLANRRHCELKRLACYVNYDPKGG
jgi:hypothetical protein